MSAAPLLLAALLASASAQGPPEPAPASGADGAATRAGPAAAPESRYVVVAPAETLHVQLSGSGEPVVIVPGIFSSAFAFRKVIPLLTGAGYRVILVEPLGLGGSSRTRGADYSLTAQGRRIGAVMDSVGVGSALVMTQGIASSMGLRLALERPALVRALVSLDGGVSEAPITPGLERALGVAGTLLKIFGGEWIVKRRLRSDFRDVSVDHAWITDEALEGYMAPIRGRLGPTIDVFREMSRAAEPLPLAPRLERLRCPVVLVAGGVRNAGSVPLPELEIMRAQIPRLDIVELQDVGHLIHEERPSEVLAAVARASRILALEGSGRPR